MAIPLKYNFRNLVVRRTTTLMTATSIAVTVWVFIVLMALAEGLRTSLTTTGSPLNVLIMREGSQSETVSFVTRDSLQVIKYLDGIAKDDKGEPFVSAEEVILVNMPKIGQPQGSNVTIRGVGPDGPALRSDFKLVEGRMFKSGLREVIVSKRISERFQDCKLGDKLKFAKGYWTVVGIFTDGNSAYNSEIWGDVNDLAQDFDRESYSDVIVRAANEAAVAKLNDQIANDRRLHLKPQTEHDYYAAQTSTARPIQAFGIFIAILMSVGATFAAMNTMYAAVSRRTKEIGTLRVVGYSRWSIMLSFVIESVLISAIGGLVGGVFAIPANLVSAGTTNFTTFSEIAFNLAVTPQLFLVGVVFSVFMGFVGGLFPAWRAAHENIVTSLRAI